MLADRVRMGSNLASGNNFIIYNRGVRNTNIVFSKNYRRQGWVEWNEVITRYESDHIYLEASNSSDTVMSIAMLGIDNTDFKNIPTKLILECTSNTNIRVSSSVSLSKIDNVENPYPMGVDFYVHKTNISPSSNTIDTIEILLDGEKMLTHPYIAIDIRAFGIYASGFWCKIYKIEVEF